MTGNTAFTRRGWALLGAAIGLVVGSRLLGALELSMLGLSALALLAVAWVWARTRRIDLDVTRRLRPSRLHVGHEGRIDLAVRNRASARAPALTVSDHVEERSARFLLPPLPPAETARAAYRLPATRRGRFRVGPVAVGLTDPFGLARRRFAVAGIDEVTIRPRVHNIVPPGRAASRHEGILEASARARSSDGEEFLHLREYEVGDDLRRVHWRTTAHTDELMIRQHEAPWQPRATVVLDMRAAAHDAASFEVALEATASAVTRLLRMRRRVDVDSSSGTPLLEPGPTGSAESFLDRLAVLEPGGPDGLAPNLEALRRRRGRALVVAVLGQLSPVDAAQLHALAQTTTVIAVVTRAGVLPRAAPGLVLVDAATTPFPDAWNQAVLSWSVVAVPNSLRSRSRR
jgi:uncharacterized protein (DUF58 family)